MANSAKAPGKEESKKPVDYAKARSDLEELFPLAEEKFSDKTPPQIPTQIASDLDLVFQSKTQAYREILVSAVLARIQHLDINLRLPYAGQGEDAYNAREIDQSAVNPFLKSRQIPSSKGPMLAVFRRDFKFLEDGRRAMKDKKGYDSFLKILSYVEMLTELGDLRTMLILLLYRFVQVREESKISIAKVQRLSIPQYSTLLDSVLRVKSGGRFPVFIVVAVLRAMQEALGLDWVVQFQGINVADASNEEPGDIMILRSGKVILGAEVTERIVDKSRVISTFASKIAPSGVDDYLFFVKFKASEPDSQAIKQAEQYFAQGHEVNFLDIKSWTLNILSTIGKEGRSGFIRELVTLLEAEDTPRTMKVAWNQNIQNLTTT